jgi:hypothetical protein
MQTKLADRLFGTHTWNQVNTRVDFQYLANTGFYTPAVIKSAFALYVALDEL